LKALKEKVNNLTLESRDTGWIKENTLEQIITLADYLGVEIDVTFADNTTSKARFRLEEKAIEYEPLFDGSNWTLWKTNTYIKFSLAISLVVKNKKFKVKKARNGIQIACIPYESNTREY